MMNGYGGLNAKISAMRGRLLKRADYEELSRAGGVRQLGEILAERGGYSITAEGTRPFGRDYLERRVMLGIHDEFSRVYKFIGDGKLRDYLDAFFLKHEIDFIKSLLRSIADRRDSGYSLPDVNGLLGKNLGSDLSALFLAKTLDEAIESLNGTVFYKQLRRTPDDKPSLFELEMRLDIYYHMRLYAMQNKYLSGLNKKIAAELNGMEIDVTNLSWVYRLKRFYNPQESIYAYLIPIYHKLTRGQLDRLAEAETAGELESGLKETVYASLFDPVEGHERAYYEMKYNAFRKLRIRYPESLASALGYIYMKELEIMNVVSLTEGVGYGLEPAEMMGYLYCFRD